MWPDSSKRAVEAGRPGSDARPTSELVSGVFAVKKPLVAVLTVLALGAAAFVLWPIVFPEASGVTLYCSVDQEQALPIVEEFRKESGIAVATQGETEASRSVGIKGRLLLEKDHPVADVLWANEILNTVFLRNQGLFAPLPRDVLEAFPPRWRDPRGTFVAFAGRARILLVNTKVLPDRATWPTSVRDLLDPRFGAEGRRVCVAAPLTGTTYTHAAAMLAMDERGAKAFWSAIAERSLRGEVKVVPGNGAVKQQVADAANGVAFGLTDTDDAREAIDAGAPVEIVYPDQADGLPGTFVIPNTVAIVRGGPHPRAAEALVRWLASKGTEARLAAGRIANIPVRDDVVAPPYVRRAVFGEVKDPAREFRAQEVDWDLVGSVEDRGQAFFRSLFASR